MLYNKKENIGVNVIKLHEYMLSYPYVLESNDEELIGIWEKSYNEDKLNSLKILFWSRDKDGGGGIKHYFKIILNWLKKNDIMNLKANVSLIPHFGRWDELINLLQNNHNRKLHSKIMKMIRWGLKDKDNYRLISKWLPRESRNPILARIIAKSLKLSYKEYRKIISRKSSTVEQFMSSNQWDKINMKYVPRLAKLKYSKTFFNHFPELYNKPKPPFDDVINNDNENIYKIITELEDILKSPKYDIIHCIY